MIDLLVVGGGPIGLAVAIRARLAGLAVVVADPRKDPIDKACGEGLMPTAVRDIAELGVRPGGHQFVGIRYIDAAGEAEARFRRGTGLGVRRVTLQAALAERAEELGVGREQIRITDVRQDAQTVQAGGLTSRWLVAADGLHSTIRRNLGLDLPGTGEPARFGYRKHFTVAPWTDFVEVYWARDVEAYVTPVSEDTVGVAILGPRGLHYDEVLHRFPQLLARLGSAPSGSLRAAGPLRQRAASRRCGRVLLVGDAAGYVDALTGEGVAVGLAAAQLAVGCIVARRPEDYDAAWVAATRRYRILTNTLLKGSQKGLLRKQIVPAARRFPAVFNRAVNLLA